jgi:hypothetical protein
VFFCFFSFFFLFAGEEEKNGDQQAEAERPECPGAERQGEKAKMNALRLFFCSFVLL